MTPRILFLSHWILWPDLLVLEDVMMLKLPAQHPDADTQ